MKPELCPFCKSEPMYNEGMFNISVICSDIDCPAHYFFPMYKTKEEAIMKWNRRKSNHKVINKE